MGSFLRLSLIIQPLQAAAILVLGALLAPHQAAGDIILDEFTDSAVAHVARGSGGFVETANVSDLNALRQIRIAAGGWSDPTGTFDIGVSSMGTMHAQIEDIELRIANPTVPPQLPLTAIQFNYSFNPTDVTEAGQNDAILFDFVELVGDIQPSFLRALVVDTTTIGSGEIALFPLLANESPHTLAMPFSAFTRRGGSPGLPDFTTLRKIDFDFFFGGHQGELNWNAQVERIRFGSVLVPEPPTLLSFGVGVVVWLWKGGRRCASRTAAYMGYCGH